MEEIVNDASKGRETRWSAGLYVLATPLGNLGDITLRALDTLRRADTIACEDTRVMRDLLRLLSIDPPRLLSVREHNESSQSDTIIARIAAGEIVVYASDAGTPAVSDPGARLVNAVREAGYLVTPIPGPSAVTAALSISGFDRTSFCFLGFAPTAEKALVEFIDNVSESEMNSVFFESPHRIEKTIAELASHLPPERRVLIARELTKKFETTVVTRADALLQWLANHAATMRGEFVLVIEGSTRTRHASSASVDARELLRALLTELPAAKAAKVAAQVTGESRQTLFDLASELRPAR